MACKRNSLEVIWLVNNNITEFNWDHAPQSLKTIWLSHNRITKVIWENVPPGLKTFGVCYNLITEFNWYHPSRLQHISLEGNRFLEFNWKGIPRNLISICLEGVKLDLFILNYM